jgi:hypothetical protein
MRKHLWKLFLATFVLVIACSLLFFRVSAQEIIFPPDSGIINVKQQPYNAKGDGTSDDTTAIQAALNEGMKRNQNTVYLPNGTYLVSDTLSFDQFLRLQGQSRSRTIVKLQQNASGYGAANQPKPVLRSLYNNNESIANYISDLTIDTNAGNPGAIGIRYNTHNQGICERVTVKSGDGTGVIGLDLSETEFGPGMVRDVLVEGFDVGIQTPGAPSNAVLEDITVRNQRVVGLRNSFPLSLHRFTSVNSVVAIENTSHPLTQLILIGANLSSGASDKVAIINDGGMYARNVTASGYKAILRDRGEEIAGNNIDERFANGEMHQLHEMPNAHLRLPIEDPPETFQEALDKWVIPVDSDGDDTLNLQNAIDSGAETIFLKAFADYQINDTIVLRGNVKRLIALREATLGGDIANFQDKPMLRIESKQPITVEHLSLSTWPDPNPGIAIATTSPVHLKSIVTSQVSAELAAKGGKLFLTDWGGKIRIDHPMDVWVRQYNPENNPYDNSKPLPTHAINRGGNLWIFGIKTEAPSIHIETTDRGRTEVLGGFFRDHFGPEEWGQPEVPFFIADTGTVTASYFSYAWGPGKARGLQITSQPDAIELSHENHRINLTAAQPSSTNSNL